MSEAEHVPLVSTPLISPPPPEPDDLGRAPIPEPQPTMSLLHRPGRPLTMADFPPSQTPPEADLPFPTPEDALPYHRRLFPDPLTLPMDESRLLSAILGSINYGQDTVLALWKRAEA